MNKRGKLWVNKTAPKAPKGCSPIRPQAGAGGAGHDSHRVTVALGLTTPQCHRCTRSDAQNGPGTGYTVPSVSQGRALKAKTPQSLDPLRRFWTANGETSREARRSSLTSILANPGTICTLRCTSGSTGTSSRLPLPLPLPAVAVLALGTTAESLHSATERREPGPGEGRGDRVNQAPAWMRRPCRPARLHTPAPSGKTQRGKAAHAAFTAAGRSFPAPPPPHHPARAVEPQKKPGEVAAAPPASGKENRKRYYSFHSTGVERAQRVEPRNKAQPGCQSAAIARDQDGGLGEGIPSIRN